MKKTKPFKDYCQGLSRPVQCVVKFAFWLTAIIPFAAFDLLRLIAIWTHDLGEWLLTVVADEDLCWIREWWKLRKQI